MKSLLTTFLFFNIIFRAMGCLVPLLIVLGLGAYIIYSVGGFEGGIKNTKENLTAYLNKEAVLSKDQKAIPQLTATPQPLTQKKQPSINPLDYPTITAPVHVIRSDVLRFYNGEYLKLYGINGLDTKESCTNNQGRRYSCGKQSKAWLQNWLQDYELRCHILKTDAKNNSLGVCFLGSYEIAAAIVQAGWAQASEDIYIPYQDIAKSNKQGIWQGIK